MESSGGDEQRGAAQPTSARERLVLIDAIRGFAILGILSVNLPSMKSSAWYRRLMVEDAPTPWTLTYAAESLRYFLAEGKFITILSLLFGFGFGMLLEKAEKTGDRFLLHRRLVCLLLIGLLHAFLIWPGDILALYAFAGLALLLFRHCRPRTLCVWAALLYGAGIVSNGLVVTAIYFGAESMGGPGTWDGWLQYLHSTGDRIYSSGSFGEIMQHRALEFSIACIFLAIEFPETVSLFVLGLAAWKAGYASRLGVSAGMARVVLYGALPIAFLSHALPWAISSGVLEETLWTWILVLPLQSTGPSAMAAVYISLLVICWEIPVCRLLLHPLAPVGRMALTNYLLQSAIVTTIFYSYGGGFYGKISFLGGLGVIGLVWAIELTLSRWWLRHFPMGPLEWMWRSFTYRRWRFARSTSPR